MENLSGHNAGHRKKISDSNRKEIRSALNEAGYSSEMILNDVGFVGQGGKPLKTDMVAYSSTLRHDTDTAVISIKGTEDAENILFDPDISPFRALATPIIILAEYKAIRGKDEPRVRTFGLCKDAAAFNRQKSKKLISKTIPLSQFKEYLRDNQEYFTPRRLEKAKFVPEQLTLFDIAPNLIKQAIDIADKELIDRFEKGVMAVIKSTDDRHKQSVINAAIAILGARILRDRLKKEWPLTSGTAEFLNTANKFLPQYFNVPSGIACMLDPLLNRLHSAFDFSQVSLDMVGKFYASAFVTKELRDQWGIHYTPSILAKTLLRRIPIEDLPPDNRILADPTCGSGSLLVAGYERLANATYLSIPQDERHQRLVGSIFGNDRDEFAAKIARMTLMLFHPPHKNNWNVSRLDAESDQFEKKWVQQIKIRPSIIVANPPFGGKSGSVSHPNVPRARNQPDRSASILNLCLEILPEGGLLGIILTETVLDQLLEKSTRHRMVQKCQILEQWDIPVGWFDDVKRPAMAWVLRKAVPTSKTVYIRCLSDVPSLGRQTRSNGTIRIDVTNPPDKLVPTVFENILYKMEISQYRIKDYYGVYNGLQPLKGKIKESKSFKMHPWSGSAKKSDPYSDFGDGRNGWLDLIDANFGQKSPRRKLRKHLENNEPMVMLRANRNAPWKYKYSSIALIDVPVASRKVVAPSESFDATFSKSENGTGKKNYTYALWAILNHPLASLWFHERQKGHKIPVGNYRKEFPLPKGWNEENILSLSSTAKELIDTKRNMRLKPLLEPQDSSIIEGMVNKIDDIIYQMYEINKDERGRIEEWFGEEKRPLLESISRRKASAKNITEVIGINYEVTEWETTCETLEVHFKKNLIRLVIDGLTDYPDAEEGIWLKIIPAMPGWLLEKGAVGWVELTSDNAKSLKRLPEQYIVGFHLHKNAYKTQDEIDKALQLTLTPKMKKAEANG